MVGVVRRHSGRTEKTSFLIVDAQSVKNTDTAEQKGFDGGKLKPLADIVVHLPCDQYGVIEDLHMSVGHILTFYLKQR